MDTFYLSHGSPALSVNDKIPARPFFKSWQEEVLREAPRAILVISGHWESDRPTVNVIHGINDTIYDFRGVHPDHMYQLKYPAPGAPDLANSVKELLEKAGFGEVEEDKTRGLDHGAWVPLMLMYPEANIPVCQLSVQTERDGTYHYNMGKAIAPLRHQGILIIGSGSATHNLRTIEPGSYGGPTSEWALNFDTWLNESLLNGRYEHINHYEDKSPCAKMAHPSPDHFYPLNVALGAAGEKARAEQIHHSWAQNTVSYASYRFTTAETVQV